MVEHRCQLFPAENTQVSGTNAAKPKGGQQLLEGTWLPWRRVWAATSKNGHRSWQSEAASAAAWGRWQSCARGMRPRGRLGALRRPGFGGEELQTTGSPKT
ncbi:hypothetical protein E2320_007389, partial [Naja naja]